MEKVKIGIVGSGNVGVHLARAFSAKLKNKVYLYTHSDKNAQLIHGLFKVIPTNDILFTKEKPDYIILAVNDSSISELSKKYKDTEALLLHTSGGISIGELSKDKKIRCGVLYPLQSFSIQRKLTYSEIPFLIESNNKNDLALISDLISTIGANWTEVSSENRKKIHLSAVVVNNFVNHMYTQGGRYLENNELSFDLLLPLINETAARLSEDSPANFQTGPAIRADLSVIKEHLNLLDHDVELQGLYKHISDSIANFHKKT